jgi:carbon-monoxide dehydrogenase large subunit
MEEAAKLVDYWQRRKERKPYVGIGISNHLHPGAGDRWWLPINDSDMATCIVRVETDGSVLAVADIMDMGQGHKTTLAQICADELGVRIEDVHVIQGDTDEVPFGLGSYGSRSIAVGGTAMARAARIVRDKLFKIASHWFETNPEDLAAKDGKIYVKNKPEKSVSIADAAYKAQLFRNELPIGTQPEPLIGIATYDPPTSHGAGGAFSLDDHCGATSMGYGCGTNIAVVEVDPRTGLVRILDYAIAQDVGRPINPEIVKGQLLGGVVQGLGYGLSEEILYGEKGDFLNASFLEYKIFSAADTPKLDVMNKVVLVETFEPSTSHGQKGVGEMGRNNAAAALANAVSDALGLRITEIPVTPERILRILREKHPKLSGRK